ncbi:hypothetical protein SISSUDRAFT_990323, partial [Sistotremastrum suecicum HHB10207 ss-3]
PPFYMVAYEVNGIATTSLIGTDPNDLSWEVNHGPDCTCQTPGTWSPVEIHPNVTSLNTCDALELDFQGGTPPYSVTITSEGLAVVSNLTLAPNEHEFVWTDQLSPGSIVIGMFAALFYRLNLILVYQLRFTMRTCHSFEKLTCSF